MRTRSISAASALHARPGQKRKTLLKRIWMKKWCYLIILPGMVYFLLFKYVPMYGIQLAFKEFDMVAGISASPWVGWSNFELLFRDREFFLALKNTLIISYMQLLLFFPFPVILAILFNEVKIQRFKKSVQTILTFPHFLSWVIVAGIMMNILANNGAVNNLLAAMGMEKYQFMTDKGLFRYILIFSLTWKESGWSTILYIAAITGIDPALYEAATIDGANRWHRIIHITWPGILPVVIITLILRVGHMMDAGFDQIMNMYNSTVLDVGDILDTYIYRITFQRTPNFGFSTAVGLFKGLTNCILLLSVNVVCKKISGTGIL